VCVVHMWDPTEIWRPNRDTVTKPSTDSNLLYVLFSDIVAYRHRINEKHYWVLDQVPTVLIEPSSVGVVHMGPDRDVLANAHIHTCCRLQSADK